MCPSSHDAGEPCAGADRRANRRPQKSDAPAGFPESWRGHTRLSPSPCKRRQSTTGQIIIQWIWQAACYLADDIEDLPHDITAVAAGGALEQIADGRADLCLGVVGAGEIPARR